MKPGTGSCPRESSISNLLEKVVTNLVYGDAPIPNEWVPETSFNPSIARTARTGRASRTRWSAQTHPQRAPCAGTGSVEDGVPGDFIETVCVARWRVHLRSRVPEGARHHGPAGLGRRFLRGIPDTGADGHPLDREMALHQANEVLGVSLETVRRNFERYGLLDDQVRFLPGWFKDTLPDAPVDALAVMRLDGDLYESTMDALENLYPKLSRGGFVIIDDYVVPACRKAVDDFRKRNGIEDAVQTIDEHSVFWRRGRLTACAPTGAGGRSRLPGSCLRVPRRRARSARAHGVRREITRCVGNRADCELVLSVERLPLVMGRFRHGHDQRGVSNRVQRRRPLCPLPLLDSPRPCPGRRPDVHGRSARAYPPAPPSVCVTAEADEPMRSADWSQDVHGRTVADVPIAGSRAPRRARQLTIPCRRRRGPMMLDELSRQVEGEEIA